MLVNQFASAFKYYVEIEDLTRVVISYEPSSSFIISNEMITSIRFCLPYDCFKYELIALKVAIISTENITLSRMAS